MGDDVEIDVTGASPDEIVELIRKDREEWPMGHPCRGCGCVYADHPNTECAAWY